MHKSEITAVFLAAILLAGAITAALPTFIGNAQATEDKRDKDRDRDKYQSYDDGYKKRDSKYRDDSYDKDPKYKYRDDSYDKDPKYKYRDDSYDKDPKYRDKSYYDQSSAYGQKYYKKPSYGTDYNYDHDKKIIKKIIVVCPDGSKVPVNGGGNMGPGNMGPGTTNFGGMTNFGDNDDDGFIHKIIKEKCPPVSKNFLDCEKCFEWILNWVDVHNKAAVVNVIIDAINDEAGEDVLEHVEFNEFHGLLGSDLWEICEALDDLLSGKSPTQKGQVLADLIAFIEDQTDLESFETQFAIDIIECIAKLQGITIPPTSTTTTTTPSSGETGNLGDILPDIDLPLSTIPGL